MALEPTDASEATAPGVGASTFAEAFQATVAERAGQIALRTKDDEMSLSWAEYAERVRRVAAGLDALGIGRGDTVGIMLTNRPEFHFADTGAMHLGAVPFSIYNTSSGEQIEYMVGDSATRLLFTEREFLDFVLAARRECETLEHVVVVDGEAGEGAISLERAGSARRGRTSTSRRPGERSTRRTC